jgi:hypothetical protein
LTVKPDGFFMHVTPRIGRDIKTTLGGSAAKAAKKDMNAMTERINDLGIGKIDLSIYYGKTPVSPLSE